MMGEEFPDGMGGMTLEDIPFGSAPLGETSKTLRVTFYLPDNRDQSVPLLVWYHAGAFRSGTYNHASHRKIARWLGQKGIALATPEYRLGAVRGDLSEHVQDNLERLRGLRDPRFRRDLAQARSLAALEDSLSFLNWLRPRCDEMGIGGRIVLGGSSAGAINVFNICFTAPFLDMTLPVEIGGLLSYSGGYAYPSLYVPERLPVFAAHNPDDDRVSIHSIRHLAQRDSGVDLIESREQDHGSVKIFNDENKHVSFGRMISHISRMSGLSG